MMFYSFTGKYGKTPGLLKPLKGLKLKELREELHTRGTYDTDKKKGITGAIE